MKISVTDDRWLLMGWGGIILCFTVLSIFIPSAGFILLGGTVAGAVVWIFLRKPSALFYLLGAILPLQIGIYAQSLLDITFTPVLIFSLITTVVLVIKLLQSHRIPKSLVLGLWLILVTISALSFTQSPVIRNAIQGVWVIYRLALVAPLVFLAYFWLVKRPEVIRKTLEIIIMAAALSAAIGIIQTASHGNLLSGVMTNGRYLGFLMKFPPEVAQEDPRILQDHFYYQGIFRAHGTFYRVNGYAAFLSTIGVLTWCLSRGVQGKKRRIFFTAFLFQMAGVIVSFSRSAWAATLTGLAAAFFIEMFIIHHKKLFSRRNVSFILIISFLAALILVAGFSIQSVRARFTTFENLGNVDEVIWRLNVWKIAFNSIVQHPLLGVGDSTVVAGASVTGSADFGAHNLYIGLAYEQGIIVFAIIVFFIIKSLASSWEWIKTSEEISEKALAMGIFAATIAFLVSGVGGALLDIENLAALLWLFMGIGITKSFRS